MTSDDPPDSSTFDSLWESMDDAEEPDLPPALGPPRKVAPEQRDTLLPPMPHGEYVQTMMELGELDDPTGMPAGALAPPPRVPATPPLGLVLASERDFTLGPDDGDPRWGSAPNPASGDPVAGASFSLDSGAKGPPTPRQAWTPAHPAGHGTGAPRKGGATAPRGGRNTSAVPMAPRAPAPAYLPVPRAPSIPPTPEPDEPLSDITVTGLDSLQDLDSLDSLDSLDAMPFPDMVAAMPRTPPPRATPPTRPTPPTGLRLARTPPRSPAVDEGERVTPVSGPRWDPEAAYTPAGPAPGPVSEPAPSSVGDRAQEMQALFEAKSFSSALVLAESVLVSNPAHALARRCAESCREMLAQKYLDRLGGRAHVPRLSMPPEEIPGLSLDHRAGFLLSFIDGEMSIDEVLDVSSMAELDALRIMFELRQQSVIEIEEPNRRPGRR